MWQRQSGVGWRRKHRSYLFASLDEYITMDSRNKTNNTENTISWNFPLTKKNIQNALLGEKNNQKILLSQLSVHMSLESMQLYVGNCRVKWKMWTEAVFCIRTKRISTARESSKHSLHPFHRIIPQGVVLDQSILGKFGTFCKYLAIGIGSMRCFLSCYFDPKKNANMHKRHGLHTQAVNTTILENTQHHLLCDVVWKHTTSSWHATYSCTHTISYLHPTCSCTHTKPCTPPEQQCAAAMVP